MRKLLNYLWYKLLLISPYPKNPKIARFFKEIGWVDELGSGIRNVYKYSKIYLGADPEFLEGDVFKTIIPLVSKSVEEIYISEQDSEQVEKIIEFCKNPKTRSEIQKFIGIKS